MDQTPGKKEYCGKTTIRILKDKEWVYEDFKKLVLDRLHSDLCYVTVSLWEAFVLAFEKVPNPEEPIMLNFPRQNIQINMGCNLNYNVKKSRRKPEGIRDPLSQPRVELRKNLFFPLLLEEWETLSEEKKRFWYERLVEAGIIQQSEVESSFPIHEKAQQTNENKKSDSMEQCMAFDGKQRFLGFLRWLVTPLW